MSNSQMVQAIDNTETSNLYIAFELSNSKWKGISKAGNRRIRSMMVELSWF